MFVCYWILCLLVELLKMLCNSLNYSRRKSCCPGKPNTLWREFKCFYSSLRESGQIFHTYATKYDNKIRSRFHWGITIIISFHSYMHLQWFESSTSSYTQLLFINTLKPDNVLKVCAVSLHLISQNCISSDKFSLNDKKGKSLTFSKSKGTHAIEAADWAMHLIFLIRHWEKGMRNFNCALQREEVKNDMCRRMSTTIPGCPKQKQQHLPAIAKSLLLLPVLLTTSNLE